MVGFDAKNRDTINPLNIIKCAECYNETSKNEIMPDQDDVKSNQEKLQQDVASSKPNIDDIPYVSYNETLIWKITSFHGKKNTSFYFELRSSKVLKLNDALINL
ncbi:unnamed protein product [Rotaria sordida]|uniref:Uncharacterized protein n=1 Tax=Rotaria sordida TaxID=392033 RepID=A0A815PI51_9BILA|nr:unnamed protein product [Rotaria sordida]